MLPHPKNILFVYLWIFREEEEEGKDGGREGWRGGGREREREEY